MTQYILLVHNHGGTQTTPEEWERFFALARESGAFKGGSEIGERWVIGDAEAAKSTSHIAAYLRFDSGDRSQLMELLEQHPVVLHGGSVELCELPKS